MESYRRRVQLVGGSSLTISLPKPWAKEVGLKPGDEVLIEVLPDKSLRIHPPSRGSFEKARLYTIDLSREPDENVIIRRIMAGYVAGYNTIRLVGRSKVDSDVVESALSTIRSKTIGLEVMDEDLDSITLQCIVDTGFAKVMDVLKRLVRVAVSMHEDVLSCLTTSATCKALNSEFRERDDIADKLYLLLLRQLVAIVSSPEEAEKQRITPAVALFLALIAKNIERIADYASNIAKLAINNTLAIREDVVQLYREAVSLLRDTAKILLGTSKQALDLLKRADKLREYVSQARGSYADRASLAERLVIETISRLVGHTMDILEAVMDIDALRSLQSGGV